MKRGSNTIKKLVIEVMKFARINQHQRFIEMTPERLNLLNKKEIKTLNLLVKSGFSLQTFIDQQPQLGLIGAVNYNKLTKWEKHELKQIFLRGYASGRKFISQYSIELKISRRTLYKWALHKYGTTNIRPELMYKMYVSGIPTRAIAEFYGVDIVQVYRSVKKQKLLATSLQ